MPRVTGMLVVDSVIAGDWDLFWDALAHLAQPASGAGVFLDGLHHPHDARLHDRSAVRRIHHHRARKGTVGHAHPVAARVRQHRGATGNGAGAGLCRTAGRRGDHRNGIFLAWSGALPHGIAVERRHECGAWRHAGGRARLPGPEPAGRLCCIVCWTRASHERRAITRMAAERDARIACAGRLGATLSRLAAIPRQQPGDGRTGDGRRS